MNNKSSFDTVKKLERHIAQMAPHQRERVGGELLIEALAELKELHRICSSEECLACGRLVPHIQQYTLAGAAPLCKECFDLKMKE